MSEITLPEQRARLDWIRQHPEFMDLPEYEFIFDRASERLEQLEREAEADANYHRKCAVCGATGKVHEILSSQGAACNHEFSPVTDGEATD